MDRFSVIREWDIDLLLLEEFCCSALFVGWFYEKARVAIQRLPELNDVACKARHSVSYSGEGGGESDLEVLISGRDGSTRFSALFLIEDKIGAQFTPMQSQRYRQRAAAIARKQTHNVGITVLVAPKQYIDASENGSFDFEISYEDVIDYFNSTKQSSSDEYQKRSAHRSIALAHAVEKCRRGGTRIISDTRTQFFYDFFAIANQSEPTLAQKSRHQRTANSNHFYFQLEKRLTNGVKEYIGHDMKKGSVAIELRGLGQKRLAFASKLREIVEHDMTIDCPPEKKYVRILLRGYPRIDPNKPAHQQRDNIEKCAHAAARLFQWHQSHYDTLRKWVSLSSDSN